MKTPPQNVLKMSAVSPDTSRETATPLTWLQQQSNGPAFCIRLAVCFSAARLR